MPTALLPEPIVDDATRRQFLAGLTAAGLLAGCARATDGSDPAPAAEGLPRTLRHGDGDLALDAPPERVFVGTQIVVLDDVLALGVQPVAVMDDDAEQPWTTAALTGKPARINLSEPEQEKVAAARPDLVITLDGDQEYEPVVGYRDIAPVLFAPLDLAARMRLLGEVFGREQRARELVENHTATLRDLDIDRGGTITAFFPTDDGSVYVVSPNLDGSPDIFTTTLAAAGLRSSAAPADGGFAQLSAENVGQLDDDHLWLIGPYSDSPTAADQLETTPLFQRIPAVTEGRYHRLTIAQSRSLLFATTLSLPATVVTLTTLLPSA